MAFVFGSLHDGDIKAEHSTVHTHHPAESLWPLYLTLWPSVRTHKPFLVGVLGLVRAGCGDPGSKRAWPLVG